MKNIITLLSLIFMISATIVPVNAIDQKESTTVKQVASLDNNSYTDKTAENTLISLSDEVAAINQKHGDLKEYDRIKNKVYTELSDYMKIKYKLYNIYVVEDFQLLTIAKDKPERTRGLISFISNSIIIENAYYKNRSIMGRILLHELGHALDTYDETDNYPYKQTGKYTKTNEFKEIFETEKYCLRDVTDEYYFTDKIGEYFAECYAIYIERPDKMKKEAPKTYEFMNKVANQTYVDIPTTDYIVNTIKRTHLSPALEELESEKINNKG